MIETQKYIKTPLVVDAVQVTLANFDEIATWCQGEVELETGKDETRKYIKIRVHNPKNVRQSKAFVGDWLLYTERGYKVYMNKAFHASFNLVTTTPEDVVKAYPYEDGGFVVLGPEIFAGRNDAGELVISWKGENFVAQPDPVLRSAIEEMVGHDEMGEPFTEFDAAKSSIADTFEGETTPQDEPSAEDPYASINQGTGPDTLNDEPTPFATDKRVLSLEQQNEMDPDEIRELLQTGDYVLAQDLTV